MNKKEFILKLVDIIFTTVCFLVIVCICFLGGFACGFKYESIDNLSNEAGASSVTTMSSLSPQAVVSSGEVFLDGPTTSFVGFSTNTSYNLSWSSLTSAVPSSSNFSFYKWNFGIVYNFADNGNFDYTNINFYCGAYYNTAESLVPRNTESSVTMNGLPVYRLDWVNIYNNGDIESDLNYTSAGIFYKSAQYKSSSYNSYLTRVGLTYSFGQSNGVKLTPSFNFVKRSMGNYTSRNNPFLALGAGNSVYDEMSTGRYNWIQWTDSTGFSVAFAIPIYYTSTNTPTNRPMWYYTDSNLYFYDGFVSDTSNSYYQQGYTTGYSEGQLYGETIGYNNGYTKGYDDGEVDGYNNGITSANDYSFASLLTSAVSAPVTVFIDLLDFNIMGYSLLSIVMGLLTLGLVVLIIKLCLGGK